MKKWLLALFIILALLIGAVYLFIPNYIKIHKNVALAANDKGLLRKLGDGSAWSQWWPDAAVAADTSYTIHGNNYKIIQRTFNAVRVAITNDNMNGISEILLVGLANADSSRLSWDARIPTSYNPIRRLQIYLAAKKAEKDMDDLTAKFQSHFSMVKNVYDYEIRKEKVIDSTLVSTYTTMEGYPSDSSIYQLIGVLRTYISANGAKETGSPMLNVSTSDSIHFLLRAAIPVDKVLPSSGNITYKWMLGGGNILLADVKGGPGTVKNALQKMESYVVDYRRIVPAIYFLSLVTERMQQPDTSQWITRIYYPVM